VLELVTPTEDTLLTLLLPPTELPTPLVELPTLPWPVLVVVLPPAPTVVLPPTPAVVLAVVLPPTPAVVLSPEPVVELEWAACVWVVLAALVDPVVALWTPPVSPPTPAPVAELNSAPPHAWMETTETRVTEETMRKVL
jgi:hypothetical protein